MEDFQREFVHRPWWSAQRMVFALLPNAASPVGTVTLAGSVLSDLRISWLAVDPDFQRCGIGRLLVEWAESNAYQLGGRRLIAETLATWTQAMAFYQAMGYVSRGGDSPEPSVG
jgi:GNAT superfamily N-acetyltransferase